MFNEKNEIFLRKKCLKYQLKTRINLKIVYF